jgi:hypothetical protein
LYACAARLLTSPSPARPPRSFLDIMKQFKAQT